MEYLVGWVERSETQQRKGFWGYCLLPSGRLHQRQGWANMASTQPTNLSLTDH